MNIKIPLKWIACCQVKNRVYFMNMTFNAVFYLDIEDLSIHFVHRFSFERENASDLSHYILFDENTLFFFPNKTNVIMKYDILRKQEQSIPITGYHDNFFLTADIVRKNHLIYMFPFCMGKGIYVFNLLEQKVEKDRELSLLFDSESYCGSAFLVHDDCILIGMYGSNQLIEINLETKKIVYKKSLEKEIQIDSLCFDGNSFWILSGNSTDIYEWNREKDILQRYTNEHVVWGDKRKLPYSNMVFLEDEILVLNSCMKNIQRINKEKKTIGNPIAFPKGFRLSTEFRALPVLTQYTVLQDKVFLYPLRGNMLLVYDKSTRQLTGLETEVSDREVPYLRKALQEIFVMEQKPHIEAEILGSLGHFMEIVETDKNENSLLEKERIGKLIYWKILNS